MSVRSSTLRAAGLGLVLAGAAATPSGCDTQPAPDALFPLEPGLTWRYTVETRRKGKDPVTDTRIMENVERDSFAGEADVTIRRNTSGTRYYVLERDDGYYRLATESVTDGTPIMDRPPTRILPLPAEVGTTWREPAHTYMLRRAMSFMARHASNNTVLLEYRIEASGVSVDVPAGRFDDCVLAVGSKTFTIGADAGVVPTDVPIEQREWYCPGVGLTRLERDEAMTSENRMISGGHISMELTRAPGR